MTNAQKAAYNKSYHESHREQSTAYNKIYYKSHRDYYAVYGRDYRKSHREEHAAYVEANREQIRISSKDRRLRLRYGITLEQYDAMFKDQGGVCAVCGCVQHDKDLAVDHNHETGEVRGLLCDRCNRAIGLLKEKAESADRMAAYLRKHEERKSNLIVFPKETTHG